MVAGAGAGKTETMASRVVDLVANGMVAQYRFDVRFITCALYNIRRMSWVRPTHMPWKGLLKPEVPRD